MAMSLGQPPLRSLNLLYLLMVIISNLVPSLPSVMDHYIDRNETGYVRMTTLISTKKEMHTPDINFQLFVRTVQRHRPGIAASIQQLTMMNLRINNDESNQVNLQNVQTVKTRYIMHLMNEFSHPGNICTFAWASNILSWHLNVKLRFCDEQKDVKQQYL
eukprot:UN05680